MRVVATEEILTLPEGNNFEVVSLSRREARYYSQAYTIFTRQMILGDRFSERSFFREHTLDRMAVEVSGDDIPNGTNVVGLASIRSLTEGRKHYAQIESFYIDGARTQHMKNKIGNLLLGNSLQIEIAGDYRVLVDPLLEANEPAKTYLAYIGFRPYKSRLRVRELPKHMRRTGTSQDITLFGSQRTCDLRANLDSKNLY